MVAVASRSWRERWDTALTLGFIGVMVVVTIAAAIAAVALAVAALAVFADYVVHHWWTWVALAVIAAACGLWSWIGHGLDTPGDWCD